MQSAGYEAIAAGTPLVSVPTRVLRDYYGGAALYVDNSPRQIAAAARTMVTDAPVWEEKVRSRRDQLLKEQEAALIEAKEWARTVGVEARPA